MKTSHSPNRRNSKKSAPIIKEAEEIKVLGEENQDLYDPL